MKKLTFKFLFLKHTLMQFLRLKDHDDNIIKIWQDEETQDTCLYLKGRSGVWYMPVGRMCKGDKNIYSNWLASMKHMSKYGIKSSNRKTTIYTLINVKEEK